MRRIRTLIVDDSALVRKVVTDSLAHDPEIEVVGTAMDPYVARDKILALRPDVMTLDIEMPRMDGITFLKLVMQHHPMPVIIMSSLTQAGSAKTFEALQAGAVDVIGKPSGASSAHADGAQLAAKIKAAAAAQVRRLVPAAAAPAAGTAGRTTVVTSPKPPSAALTALSGPRSFAPRSLILMGASTGGTEALKYVLTSLPADLPGICIVQHIPAYFSRAFADRLGQLCSFEVREAAAGDLVQPGLALIAPGGHHVVLRWNGSGYLVELNDGPPVHHQRPAVDVLFNSAVNAGAAPHTLALLLTGMGCDGAASLLKLRQAGAATVAQDEESCVVFGMPREAIRLGAAQHILPLDRMAGHINTHASRIALR